MKRFVTLLLISISFISLFAEERNIELQERKAEAEARSLSYKPTVTYDDNTLRIYSDISLENLTITVIDIYNGGIIYNNNVTIFSKQTYSIQLNIESAYNCDYRIELESSSNSLYGIFLPSKK